MAAPPTRKTFAIAVECQIETFDGEPPFLTKDHDGKCQPLELAGINDFHVSHHTVDGDDAHEPRILLSAVEPSRGARRTFRNVGEVDSNGPAIHFEATATISIADAHLVRPSRFPRDRAASILLTIRAVARPEQHYAFFVGYIGDDVSRRCYLVEVLPINTDKPTDSQVDMFIRAEIERVARGRRSEDRWAVGPPLLTEHSIVLREGAVKYTRHFRTGKQVIEKDPALVAAMTPEEAKHARAWQRPFFRELSRRGIKASYDRDEIRRSHALLVEACTRLLKETPAAGWPAFGNLETALHFTRQHVAGDDATLRNVARELLRGLRRPSSHDLAMRVLARQVRLTPRRLRDLIRK